MPFEVHKDPLSLHAVCFFAYYHHDFSRRTEVIWHDEVELYLLVSHTFRSLKVGDMRLYLGHNLGFCLVHLGRQVSEDVYFIELSELLVFE